MALRRADALLTKTAAVLAGALLAPTTRAAGLEYGKAYSCGGERLEVAYCRADSDSGGVVTPPLSNYCKVTYLDRPRRNGFLPETSELLGDILTRLRSCGHFGSDDANVAGSSSAAAANARQPPGPTPPPAAIAPAPNAALGGVLRLSVAFQTNGDMYYGGNSDDGVCFRSGQIWRPEGVTFLLLDRSLSEILESAGLKPLRYGSGNQSGLFAELLELGAAIDNGALAGRDERSQLLASWANSGMISNAGPLTEWITALAGPGAEDFHRRAQAAIKPHVKATLITDRNGSGQFDRVPVGSYHVVGTFKVDACNGAGAPRSPSVWNVPVRIGTANSTLQVSVSNAALFN